MIASKEFVSQQKHTWPFSAFVNRVRKCNQDSSKQKPFSSNPTQRTADPTATYQENPRTNGTENETDEKRNSFGSTVKNFRECCTKPPSSELQKIRNLLVLFRHRIPQVTVMRLSDALRNLEEWNSGSQYDDDFEIPLERTVDDHLKTIKMFVCDKGLSIEEKVRKHEEFSDEDIYYLDCEMVRKMIQGKNFREYLMEMNIETMEKKKICLVSGKDKKKNLEDPLADEDAGSNKKGLGIKEMGCMNTPVKRRRSHTRLAAIEGMIENDRENPSIPDKKCEPLQKSSTEVGSKTYQDNRLTKYVICKGKQVPVVDSDQYYEGHECFRCHPRSCAFKEQTGIYRQASSEARTYEERFVGVYFNDKIYTRKSQLRFFYRDFIRQRQKVDHGRCHNDSEVSVDSFFTLY